MITHRHQALIAVFSAGVWYATQGKQLEPTGKRVDEHEIRITTAEKTSQA